MVAKFTNLEDYNGLGKAIQISNGKMEVVVTLDIGPRVIKFALTGQKNILAEGVNQSEKVFNDVWNIYGGHRVWHSPEVYPRSYMPDNEPVEKYELTSNGVILYQKEEPWVQVQKVMEVYMMDDRVKIVNKLVNKGAWPVEMAVWSLTVGSRGGMEVVPVVQRQTGLLPNRSVVLWPYAAMNDERVYWGKKYITVDCSTDIKDAFKFGCADEYGWAAYFNNNNCFIKKFCHQKGGTYPDYGCSWQTYAADWGVELESLSPLSIVKPGTEISHTDEWFLFDNIKKPGNDEEVIDSIIAPLAKKADIKLPLVNTEGWDPHIVAEE